MTLWSKAWNYYYMFYNHITVFAREPLSYRCCVYYCMFALLSLNKIFMTRISCVFLLYVDIIYHEFTPFVYRYWRKISRFLGISLNKTNNWRVFVAGNLERNIIYNIWPNQEQLRKTICPLAGFEPSILRLRCSALTNWTTESSCRALTTSSCIYSI